MTGTKERLKQNAQHQREIRAVRDRDGLCRTCGDPAVVSDRTGRLTKQCRRHLGLDVARKEVYILPVGVTIRPHRGKPYLELHYPLSGALP